MGTSPGCSEDGTGPQHEPAPEVCAPASAACCPRAPGTGGRGRTRTAVFPAGNGQGGHGALPAPGQEAPGWRAELEAGRTAGQKQRRREGTGRPRGQSGRDPAAELGADRGPQDSRDPKRQDLEVRGGLA